ncbi:MAG: type II secretion system F family protein [Candidatus Terrybacteria bacterium]|nr:type II secretion system F family protein [Candidatus Terrybacteria bacterium]
MATFIYEAANKEGFIEKGKFEAGSKSDVVQYLERKNLIPILIEAEGEAGRLKGLRLSLFETIRPTDRILLVRNLSATIRAGLNILESLDILIADATKNIMKKILGQAKFNLQKGQPLSATFVQFKKYFPPVFVGLIKAGEASGRLDESLDELSRYLIKEYNLKKKIKSALAYPVILLIGSIGVIAMLLLFVLPRLAKSFQMSKVELPFITKILISISKIFTFSPLLDLAAVVGLIWFFLYFRKTSLGRRFFLKALLRIPVARDLVKKVALVRFSRTFGGLLASGITVIEALDISAEAVSNETYKKIILDSREQVKAGIPLSRIFKNYPDFFPHLLLNMMNVGERTGTLEHILKTFSDFYEEEVDNILKDLTTFLEPILLLFMGLVIGTIALSILLPIYNLVGKFV